MWFKALQGTGTASTVESRGVVPGGHCYFWLTLVGWVTFRAQGHLFPQPLWALGEKSFFLGPRGTQEFPWDTTPRAVASGFVLGASVALLQLQFIHFLLSNQKLHVLTYLTHSLAFKQSTVATTNELLHSSNFIWLKNPKNKAYSCFSQAIISNSSINFTYRTNNYNNSQFRLSI